MIPYALCEAMNQLCSSEALDLILESRESGIDQRIYAQNLCGFSTRDWKSVSGRHTTH